MYVTYSLIVQGKKSLYLERDNKANKVVCNN